MEEYITLFNEHSEYEDFIDGSRVVLPNVSHCIQENEVHYKPYDFSDRYFTTTARESGAISFNILSSMGTSAITSISYSTDNGETWTTTPNTDNKAENLAVTVNVSQGDKVMWKGDAKQTGNWNADNMHPNWGSFFSSTCEFDAQGNVMSLLYGDNFKDKVNLENGAFCCLFSDYNGENECKIVNAKNLCLPATTLVSYCYYQMFIGCTSLTTAPQLPATTLASSCYRNMFYGCTSLTTAPQLPATTLSQDCYRYMFQNCTSLTTAPKLLATTLASNCYGSMFSSCPSLTTAPELPATTLASQCYQYMFYGCTSLTTAPQLPATTLAYDCYSFMFQNCTSLTAAPELVATTLADYCYYSMFQGCTSLATAPELPATTLANWCYRAMFAGCTSLTTAPQLPATTLLRGCYLYMFQNCTNLTTAPQLPATNLASQCYQYMFSGCRSLTTAPELHATTLADACYASMFRGCTSLTTAPQELPATTLAAYCYSQMFYTCTSLTTAPQLPATTLVNSCYQQMFYGCTRLNSITCLATNISAENCTINWVNGVAASGTFTKADEMTSWTTGVNGIPNGWNINNYYEAQPLTLKTDSGNEGVFTLRKAPYKEILYSIDNGLTWVSTTSTSTTLTASTVLLKSTDLSAWDDYNYEIGEGIDCSVNFHVQGNIMSLLYGNNYIGHNTITVPQAFYNLFINSKLSSASNLCLPATVLAQRCYDRMFAGCTSLTTAPQLPATTLAQRCYVNMFQGCTSLTTAPELPATTLASQCYQYMFYGCTSLTTAPQLLATTLANYCYAHMFYGCTSLTTAPQLPATTLADYCYYQMFRGCTSLTTAPELLATTLTSYCYQQMFWGCTRLNSITCLATDISATNCTNNWVNGVASSGTFNKEASMTGWTIGANGIPSNWTIEDYTPALEIWVDDFPYFNEIPNFVDDPEGMGSNKYAYNGTITRNNITYYTWVNSDASGRGYNYLITTTNDYNTLYQDSLEYNVGSTFSTFVERANSDFTQNYNSYDGNDMYLIKVEHDQNNNLVLWVDDWKYGPKLMEDEIADPDSYTVCHYTHNGETFVYSGTTYYLWEMVNDNTWNPNVAYLLTSTNSLSALRQESLENGYDNTFDSFVTYLTEDSEEYQVSDEQYLVKITSNSNTTLRVWVDDYQIDQDGELDGEPVEDVIQRDLNALNANGNAYEYHGDTISYNGNTYYLWERNNNIGSDDGGQAPYLATSSVDYSTLQSQSLEDDYANHFTCALGFLNEDTDVFYLPQTIGAYGENDEYDSISLLKVEEIA